jgi:DNA-binding HxlR family transcriptional regulator
LTRRFCLMRKTEQAVERCKTMSTLQKILGGKWKLEILYYIAFHDIRRFGALRRQLGEITESSLTKQLRELEADGFLVRHDFHEVPPRVEYTLTELGKSFMDVIAYMKQWGDSNLPSIDVDSAER